MDGQFRGASWGNDDTIVFASDQSGGLLRVPAGGGEPEMLTTVDPGEIAHLWPEVLPNGHAVLFTVSRAGGTTGARLPTAEILVDDITDSEDIAVLDLEPGEQTILVRGGSNPRYSPTGHIVYGAAGALRAVGFNAERLELTNGNPAPVLDNVMMKGSGAANFSLSRTGSLVYVTSDLQGAADSTLVWVDRQGREEPVGAPLRPYGWPRVSPDGTRLVFGIADPANVDIWVYDLTRATSSRLTFDDAADTDPLWTPDGERVVFRSEREGGGLFWRAADGTGPVERLTRSSNRQRPYAWARGGELLVFHEDTGATSADILGVPLEGERTSELLIQTQFSERRPAVSPDGRWIAYQSNESGQEEVYVQPFPDLAGKWQISSTGGLAPVWGPDGRELSYRNGQAVLRVPIDTEGPFIQGNPEVLFEGQYLPGDGGFGNNYDLAPDSQRFIMIKPATDDTSETSQIHVLLNWFEELNERVPVP